MTCSKVVFWVGLLLASALPAAGSERLAEETEGGAIRGRVSGAGGVAVEHARVTAEDAAKEVFTDSHGRFVLGGCALPCALVVSHPRFQRREVVVDGAGDGEVEIALQAKREVFEHVDVTASRGGGVFAPVSVASTVVHADDRVAAPATLTELVEGVAGVAENGQGGIFQVFSIRGVSRHRVLTLVAGVPIIGERRAGVSASFVDPTLMGSVDVLRGPASTHYGSGALGGVVQVFPRTFDGLELDAGYDSFGDGHYQRIGWGTSGPSGSWSLGVAHRSTDNGEAADGTELNSHFSQVSATLGRSWKAGGLDYELQAIPSYGRDIGKSNSDFPDRATNYPRETHLLLRFGVASEDGDAPGPWRLDAFVHPNDLTTADLRQGRRVAEVDNEAFDFGAGWQREWSRPGGEGRFSGLSGRYGIDLVGRRGVDAFERRVDLASGEVTELLTLDGGSQDEAAAYGTTRWGWGAATFQAGGRFTWQRQRNAGFASREDSAWTAFLGYVRPVANGFEVAANVGTGLRFPNLSERFFTGTTGRGGVIGNPDLEPEGSITLEVGLRWYGTRTFVATQVFRQRIDDYIERVEVDDDLLTFVNLTSGTLAGLELEGFHQLDEAWLFSWSGHLIDGEDDAGNPLADVPANRLRVAIEHRRGAWESRLELQHRASKDDPGSGEQAIPQAQLVSASVSYRLGSGLALKLRGRNLTDEAYFNSADDKAPLSPGRTLGISLSWSGS